VSFWQSISDSSVGLWVGQGYLVFATLEGVHLVGVALLFGTILMLDLRLLGISQALSFTWMRRHVLPVTWLGFALVTVSGVLLFTASAHVYVLETTFITKLVAMVLGGLNMLFFEGLVRLNAGRWDQFKRPPLAARASGLISIAVWVVAIVCGRWMAYEKEAVIQFSF
jgi:hypothetical protein